MAINTTDYVTVKTNLPDFRAQLAALSKEIRTKVAIAATMAALRVFKRTVEGKVPVYSGKPRKNRVPGTLKKSIYIARSKRTSSGVAGIVYGILRPKSGTRAERSGRDAYYWRWVEAGHLIRRRGQALRGGTRRRTLERKRLNDAGARRVNAVWFLRDSFRQSATLAYEAFSRSITLALNRIRKGTYIRRRRNVG